MGRCSDGGTITRGGGHETKKELSNAVITCEGNISDPNLPAKLSRLVQNLKAITDSDGDWLLHKVEPFNSVRVTFSIPKEAAVRLHQLAQAGDNTLRQLGILSVQVDGDQIVSLKVAGPNNETTEIFLRTAEGSGESSSHQSGEVVTHHSSVARSVTQAFGGHSSGILPLPGVFSHQRQQQVHPAVSQFRTPILSSDGGGIPIQIAGSSRSPAAVQQKSLGTSQPYNSYSNHTSAPAPSIQPNTRHVQQPSPSTSAPASSLSSISRPVYNGANPPPPYPNSSAEGIANRSGIAITNSFSHSPLQVEQPAVGAAVSDANESGQLYSILGQQHPVPGTASIPGNSYQVASSGTTGIVTGARAHVNMVKNSPLLVGLLQQPEHMASVIEGRSNNDSSIASATTFVPQPSDTTSGLVENGPLSNNFPSADSYTRSREGLDPLHQVYPITAPTPLAAPPQQQRQVHSLVSDDRRNSTGSLSSSFNSSSKVKDSNRIGNASIMKSASLNGIDHQVAGFGENIINTSGLAGGAAKVKDSQYLINPNTGLLEPRPNTDSSDSETEIVPPPLARSLVPDPSPYDDRQSLASDEDSNLSVNSRKETTDQSDSDVSSRLSSASTESRKCVKARSHDDAGSSPVLSWEHNAVNSSPGEKIKLRLKLGKEETTIVGNPTSAKKGERTDHSIFGGGKNSGGITEPRVPKLHIKLHSSQPVIVKPLEGDVTGSSSSRSLVSKESPEKTKRKGNRSRSRNEEGRYKNMKLRESKDTKPPDLIADESNAGLMVTSIGSRPFESKRNGRELDFETSGGAVVMKFKDNSDSKIKVPRLHDVSLCRGFGSGKMRARVKKAPVRKMGDLNSLGEIASHKILETLPPSITKVAALHTQHPYRNPSPSSMTSAVFGGSSSSLTHSSNDQLKTELEKRGSEIIAKSEVMTKVGSDDNDILMNKLRLIHPQLKEIMNGDLPLCEKVSINSIRYKRNSLGVELTPTGRRKGVELTPTGRRKGAEGIHTLETLKKEGLGSVPAFLNSSVLINKVPASNKNLISKLNTTRVVDSGSDKYFHKNNAKMDGIKASICAKRSGLKSGSDINIHSMPKTENALGMSKIPPMTSDHIERRPNVTLSDGGITKVGRITCVDVMDRKALEEALKSSRNSTSVSASTSAPKKATSTMVDRLRRWNSVDCPTSVPLTSSSSSNHPHPHGGYESTNVPSLGGARQPQTTADRNRELRQLHPIGSNVSQQVTVFTSKIDTNNDCDNSNLNSTYPRGISEKEIDTKDAICGTESRQEIQLDGEMKMAPMEFMMDDKSSVGHDHEGKSIGTQNYQSSKSATEVDQCSKVEELTSHTSASKGEIDSPESTPKGEHCNGHAGGEDSGIESMDALSEKSPNHSDQSPNRREDKDCEVNSGAKLSSKQDAKEKCSVSEIEEKIADGCSSEKTLSVDEIKDDRLLLPVSSSLPYLNSSKESEDNISSSDKDIVPVIKDDFDLNLKTDSEHSPSQSKLPLQNLEDSHLMSDYSHIPCNIHFSEGSPNSFAEQRAKCDIAEEVPFINASETEIGLPLGKEIDTATTSSSLVQHLSSPKLDDKVNENWEAMRDSGGLVGTPLFLSSSQRDEEEIQVTAIASESLSLNDDEVPEAAAKTCPSPTLVAKCSQFSASSATMGLPVTTTSPSGSNPIYSESSATVECSTSSPYLPFTESESKQSFLAITLTSVVTKSCVNTLTSTSNCSPITTNSKSDAPTGADETENLDCNSAVNYSQPTNNPASMVILASSNTTSNSTTNPSNAKVVTLKQSFSQSSSNTSINPPVGKTFRLVALPGINAMNPVSSAVKGQLVTLKPKSSQILPPSVAPARSDCDLPEDASIHVKVTGDKQLISSASTGDLLDMEEDGEHQVEDLDFVGFCNSKKAAKSVNLDLKSENEFSPVEPTPDSQAVKEMGILSPVEEEPKPLRVHPPLYTYGNRERKKDIESDIDDRKDNIKDLQSFSENADEKINKSVVKNEMNVMDKICYLEMNCAESSMMEVEDQLSRDVEQKIPLVTKQLIIKEKKLDALTIEIPNMYDSVPEADKRLTRSTRQSTRLASPKVNSPCHSVGELSPRLDKKTNSSPACLNLSQQVMGKPSPLVGFLRSSTSPAVRVVKRRRHESESSTASNLSEDLQEPPLKTPRRNRHKKTDGDDAIIDKEKGDVLASSDEDSLLDGETLREKSSPTIPTCSFDEIRPSKAVTRSRERSVETSTRTMRSTTPTRRTGRNNNRNIGTSTNFIGGNNNNNDEPSFISLVDQTPSNHSGVEGKVPPSPLAWKVEPTCVKGQERKLVATSGTKEVVIKAMVKGKRELESEQEALASRRKTRSATTTPTTTTITNNEDFNKRRRLAKDNKQ